MRQKKYLNAILCLFTALALTMTGVIADKDKASSPVAKGKMRTVSYVYSGKGEGFPVMGLLGSDQEIDIYEYDKKWVLTKCDTYVSQGNHTYGHSFYGYVLRKQVLCEPPLEGDESPKADTGPGKRKRKAPRKPGVPVTPVPNEPGPTKPEEAQKPEPTEIPTEELAEYDWIIRTPGVCQTTVDMGEGAKFVCRFAFYAMKFGGYTSSSLPIYNDGGMNPYVGYISFCMKQNMQEYLGKNNLGFLEGLGGVSIEAYNNNARFNIDSQADNGTGSIISIITNRNAVLNPQINDKNMGIKLGGDMFRDQSSAPLDIKLVGTEGSYEVALLNMKPGGGDLSFPIMLEKFPLDDIVKAERERLEKELEEKQQEEQRQKAREEQEKAVEEWRRKINEDMEEPLEGEEGDGSGIGPGEDQAELAPLVPEQSNESGGIGTGDNQIELAPLTEGGAGEEAAFFPEVKE